MASRGDMGLLLVLLTMFWEGAMAQSGCTNVLIGMAPCLNYVTGSSTTPAASCCSSLANVVQSQPRCLCTVLDGSAMAALGVKINQTLALALPGACNVKTPPVSRCDEKAAPVETPGSSPNESSGSPESSRVSGSKEVPASGTTSDASETTKTPHMLLACILFMLALLPSATNGV